MMLRSCAAGAMVWTMLALVGCAGPTMTVPMDVSKATEQVAITERSAWSGALADESFTMGDYKVTEVDRDWNSTSSIGIAGFSASDTVGGYTYGFEASGATLKGTCATYSDKQGATVGGIEISAMDAQVGCRCEGEGVTVEVKLVSENEGDYGGSLTATGAEYAVKAIYDRDGAFSDGKPSGYRVDGDGPVGAVDVLKPGKVFFARELGADGRRDLGCIFAGLLLYMPPKDD